MSDDSPTPATGRSGLVVGSLVVGLLLVLALLWAAGFDRAPGEPGAAGDDPFGLDAKAKAKGKGRGRGREADPALRDEGALWFAGPAWTAPPADRPAAPVGAPNVVLVTLSGVRRDALEPYGAPAGRSPHLAALAGGVRSRMRWRPPRTRAAPRWPC
ncbi:MAG: hypothetical protein R3F59_05625 [Myxococcota bacterium]